MVEIGESASCVFGDQSKQAFVLAQRRLDRLVCRDVGADLHETGQLALPVAQRLQLGIEPVFVPVLGSVENFNAATCTVFSRVGKCLQNCRIRLAATE